MDNLFEARIKYMTVDQQSGKEKKVTEVYLFDAVSYSDCEKRIYEEMEAIIKGDFLITKINPVNYSEIHDDCTGDTFYKAKIAYTSEVDAKKKVTNTFLILADNLKHAESNITEVYSDTLLDYDIESITKSNVYEYFRFKREI